MNNHHARSINRGKSRHQLNTRPGLINNLILLPTSTALINPLFVVNLSCHNVNNVLMELMNLVTPQPLNHKPKKNEPLMTLTPFLCFYLSPFHAGGMDYNRYLFAVINRQSAINDGNFFRTFCLLTYRDVEKSFCG